MTDKRRINRLNDALSKYVFARPERKQVALSLINAFFAFEGTAQLVDFEFLDRELSPDKRRAKRSHLDVVGISANGTVTEVEIQVDPLLSMGKRSLYYWTRLYHRLMRGEDYTKLRRTVCINILAYELFPEKETPDFHNCFGVLNKKHPKQMLTDDLEIHFVELPKWERNRPKKWTDMSHLERWLAYFSNQTSQKELEEIAMSDPMIQEALQAEREFLMDPLLLTEYDVEEDERRDRVARENYVLQQGRQEGWKQGRQDGWQQGRQEVALDMLRGKEPLNKIVTYSKLTMEQVKKLGKENGLL